jgi:ribose 5-phosphate isomerase B
MQIFIASDHAGFELKENLIKNNSNINWHDLGPSSSARVDYPDFADLVARAVSKVESTTDAFASGTCGLLICGSGQGMSMRANKYPLVRAALCWDKESAHLARAHNNANILCIPARYISVEGCRDIVKVFLETVFEGGRHERRVGKMCCNI